MFVFWSSCIHISTFSFAYLLFCGLRDIYFFLFLLNHLSIPLKLLVIPYIYLFFIIFIHLSYSFSLPCLFMAVRFPIIYSSSLFFSDVFIFYYRAARNLWRHLKWLEVVTRWTPLTQSFLCFSLFVSLTHPTFSVHQLYRSCMNHKCIPIVKLLPIVTR